MLPALVLPLGKPNAPKKAINIAKSSCLCRYQGKRPWSAHYQSYHLSLHIFRNRVPCLDPKILTL
jgi:hypothetical protein